MAVVPQKGNMRALMRFPSAVSHDERVDDWLAAVPPPLGDLARSAFASLRGCGPDVTELMHDGMPTACVEDAAFAYVNAFQAHVNLGFFCGAALPDPVGLLEGSGKFMRHVKLRPGALPDPMALQALVEAAHADVRRRLRAEAQSIAG